MANMAIARLESALRERKLDRTLTTALPPLDRSDPASSAATALTAIDTCLQGGLPRGQLSELAGAPSSGRTTLALRLVAAATARGEIAALIDACDRLDVASAAAAAIDLDRLLWVRGEPGPLDRVLDRAVKALNLVLQAGGFGIVVLDVGDVPLLALKRLPMTTWLRVQRTIEGSDTACVVLTPEPLARSAGGLTLSLGATGHWDGEADRSRRLAGLDVAVRVVSPRRRIDAECRVRVADASSRSLAL
jgi:hypothetical protein